MKIHIAVVALIASSLFVPMGHPVAEKDPRRVDLVGPQERLLNIELNKGQMVRLGAPASSVFIANPKIADVQVKSPTLAYVFGKSAGETTMFAVDANDRLLANLRIAVHHNLRPISTALTKLLPGSDIRLEAVGSAVMMSGVVRSAEVSENARALVARYVGPKSVINRLKVAGPNQVNLRVRVAEVNRAVVKEIGINWESVLNIGSFVFGLGTGRDFISDGIIQRAPSGVDNVHAGVLTNALNINALLDALENEGLVTVLAEPNLTAISGETASFLAGGEFPVTVPQGDGTISIEFKSFGVGLSFTPTLLDGGRISLNVRPEVSQLSSAGEIKLDNIAVPSLTVRRAETTVEMASGQSFAIAGLIQNNVTHDVRKFPGLGNLPVLGPLFSSDKFQRDETELVIIITPYIVRPTSGAQAKAPTDGLEFPSDYERVFNKPSYKQKPGTAPGAIRQPRGKELMGSAGFTLE